MVLERRKRHKQSQYVIMEAIFFLLPLFLFFLLSSHCSFALSASNLLCLNKKFNRQRSFLFFLRKMEFGFSLWSDSAMPDSFVPGWIAEIRGLTEIKKKLRQNLQVFDVWSKWKGYLRIALVLNHQDELLKWFFYLEMYSFISLKGKAFLLCRYGNEETVW